MSDAARSLSLFEGFGIEIEYMIVDSATLNVRPLCDRLFTEVTKLLTCVATHTNTHKHKHTHPHCKKSITHTYQDIHT